MLRVLNKAGNVVDKITGYSNYHIKTSLYGYDRTLYLRIPYRMIKDIVETEGYIETKDDRFVIKEVKPSSNTGMAEIVAALDMEALEGKAWTYFDSTEHTIAECLRAAFTGTGWTIIDHGVTKRRTVRLTNDSALAVMRQAESTYRVFLIPNAKEKRVDIYPEYGEDKGAYFKTGLNATALTVKTSTNNFFTEIEPYGKDGMTIEDVNSGSKYLSNHQYSTKNKRYIWVDERYTVKESLMEDAEAKLGDMSKPYVSYEISVKNLARLSRDYTVLEYNLGDIITILDDETGTREKQKIVEMDQYPEEPERDICTLANVTLSFEELAQRYQSAADTLDNITADNGTVKGSSVDQIDASTQVINLEEAVIGTGTFQNLNTQVLNVSGRLTAVEGDFGTLRANFGEFEELTADNFTAVNAAISRLRAEDITAIHADITNLDSAYANIHSLLNGNAGIGDLQNIHLTSQNAVIDSALIETMLADNAIVRQLIAGKIITDDVEITSGDGTLKIRGATQTITDSEGNVRVQIGEDALGDFDIIVYDATGQGQLFNSSGITPSGIGDGLLVDRMVAGNANIQASKLDINSLFQAINGSSLTLNSSRIWFDEAGQSMNQVYSQIQSNTALIGDNTAATAAADAKAQAAQAAAEQALDAISGISTLTGFVVTLSNDAHVVHTLNDGSGGDYSEAYTIVKAYLGDTDVSDHTVFTAIASAGVTGTWNATTKTYQVTDLDDEDGYVDFQCAYGHDHMYLTTRSGANLQTRSGNNLTLPSGSATITKRFSISKAPDGKIGTAYDIQCSTPILRKDTEGFIPSSVTFSAIYNDGVDMRNYSGRYRIYESTDGTNFTQKYVSATAEASKVYYPSSTDVVAIQCVLYDATGNQRLDMQTVTTLIDAQGILEDFGEIQNVVQQVEQDVTRYTTAVDRMEVQFEHLEATVIGYSDGRLLFQMPSEDNGDGTVTVRARVYKDGVESTQQYPARWFTWKLKTEDGTIPAPNGYYGYQTIVPKELMGFGGVVVGRFATYNEGYLLSRSGDNLCTRSGNQIVIFDPA